MARTLNVDLHCHSTHSDGTLTPAELVRRAAANGVTALALTDHDEIGGLEEAEAAAREHGVALVSGVELSVTWWELTVHVVGLGIDPSNRALRAGIEKIAGSRAERAERMADGLDKAGIRGSLEGASRHAGNPNLISRTHFARYLVEAGHARDVRAVFGRYLAPGKPGYVPHRWAELAEGIAWIREAGGLPVIAHPGRYRVSRPDLRRLIVEFKAAGGEGIEVVTGNHSPEDQRQFGLLAAEFDLAASRGSDFHSPDESLVDLGRLPPVAGHLRPVWGNAKLLPGQA